MINELQEGFLVEFLDVMEFLQMGWLLETVRSNKLDEMVDPVNDFANFCRVRTRELHPQEEIGLDTDLQAYFYDEVPLHLRRCLEMWKASEGPSSELLEVIEEFLKFVDSECLDQKTALRPIGSYESLRRKID